MKSFFPFDSKPLSELAARFEDVFPSVGDQKIERLFDEHPRLFADEKDRSGLLRDFKSQLSFFAIPSKLPLEQKNKLEELRGFLEPLLTNYRKQEMLELLYWNSENRERDERNSKRLLAELETLDRRVKDALENRPVRRAKKKQTYVEEIRVLQRFLYEKGLPYRRQSGDSDVPSPVDAFIIDAIQLLWQRQIEPGAAQNALRQGQKGIDKEEQLRDELARGEC